MTTMTTVRTTSSGTCSERPQSESGRHPVHRLLTWRPWRVTVTESHRSSSPFIQRKRRQRIARTFRSEHKPKRMVRVR